VERCSPREPSWTIGGKSRRRRHWGKLVETPKQRTIVIGRMTVKVNEEDYEYAVRAIQDNMELRKMFAKVIDGILEKKPLAPVGALREAFRKMRRPRVK
jgi:hypothetical protein